MKSIALLALLAFAPTLWFSSPRKEGARHRDMRATFSLDGAVEKPGDWSAERLAKEFANDLRTVRYDLKNERGTARCVPLLALIEASRPRRDEKRKNHLLAFLAVARAEDGYAVAFSLGELLPEHGNREVYLALDRNGQPLSEEEGPVRLLVIGDKKPARWVYGLSSITVLDGAQFSAKPPAPGKKAE